MAMKGCAAIDRPQVKICGLTGAAQAVACAECGADALGCVFYPPSRRCVTADQARTIALALSGRLPLVGVFVDASFASIMRRVEACRLAAVQLHGRESPALTARLRQEGLAVIKALFHGGRPAFADAPVYGETIFLAECGRGKLPGGNALRWDWAAARPLGETYPLILAGGLDAHNVATAVAAATPRAVDVSSGVERSPGDKDIDKVKRFIAALKACPSQHQLRRIF
jgi:phosphoribosylanthranilate isomerase